jgi:hypothetical protein
MRQNHASVGSMLDLAKHIVNQKASTFEPEKFEDHYEEALTELINAKRNGKTVGSKPRPKGENLMDALKRRSIHSSSSGEGQKSRAKPPRVKKKCSSRSAASGPLRMRKRLTKLRQRVPGKGPELSLIWYVSLRVAPTSKTTRAAPLLRLCKMRLLRLLHSSPSAFVRYPGPLSASGTP